MSQVVKRVRLRVVVKLETADLKAVSAYCGVLNSPEESHQESKQVELVDPKEGKGHKCHDYNDDHIYNGDNLAAIVVNHLPNEDAATHLSNSEYYHGNH